jgi:hypothetical protein
LRKLLSSSIATVEGNALSLRQALRDLDPSPIRDEVNALFDEIGARIVALQSQLMAALGEFFKAVEDFFMPITPASLVHLADSLHAELKQQILAFHPSNFKDEVKLIFDSVKKQLTVIDPSFLVTELNQLRDQLIQTLRELVTSLLPDPAPFVELQNRLATLKPSELLAPLTESLQPVTDLVSELDVKVLLEPLVEAIQRVREQVPDVIADIEEAFDEVLAAFPEGGSSGASESVTAGVSV